MLDLFNLIGDQREQETKVYVLSNAKEKHRDELSGIISACYRILANFHSQLNEPLIINVVKDSLPRFDSLAGYTFMGEVNGMADDYTLFVRTVGKDTAIEIMSHDNSNENLLMVFRNGIICRVMSLTRAFRENMEMYYSVGLTYYSCDGNVCLTSPRLPKFNFNITAISNVKTYRGDKK